MLNRRQAALGLGALAFAASRAPAQPLRDDLRQALARIPFRHLQTTSAGAPALWRRLRREGRYWPVIIGDDGELGPMASLFGPGRRPPARILAAAARLDLGRDLPRLRAAQHARDPEVSRPGSDPGLGPPPEPEAPPLGAWPLVPPVVTGPVLVAPEAVGGPDDRVHILLIPTRNGHAVPAHLNWGGWKWCPPPEYHAAFFRKWHRDHGAEPVMIASDRATLRVPRPPATRAQALALAREQFLYCPANLYQGHGDLSTAAAALMRSWWHFWWE